MRRYASGELVANRKFIAFVMSLKFDLNKFNTIWTS